MAAAAAAGAAKFGFAKGMGAAFRPITIERTSCGFEREPMVRPFGFEISDKYLKRAGLDYWPLVRVHVHENFGEVLAAYPDAPFFYASTKAPKSYAQVAYPKDVFLVFGRESRGLPENLLERVYDRCIRIPMIEGARSLNLSNSVAIVTYEALRQHGFEHLLDHGALTGRDEEPGAWMDYL